MRKVPAKIIQVNPDIKVGYLCFKETNGSSEHFNISTIFFKPIASKEDNV